MKYITYNEIVQYNNELIVPTYSNITSNRIGLWQQYLSFFIKDCVHRHDAAMNRRREIESANNVMTKLKKGNPLSDDDGAIIEKAITRTIRNNCEFVAKWIVSISVIAIAATFFFDWIF